MPAPTLVQSAQANNTAAAASITATLAATPTPGNLLVAILTSNNTLAGATHPWGSAPDFTNGASVLTSIYSKTAGAAESPMVTFSNTNSRNFTLLVLEFSPTTAGNVWSLDKTSTGSAASANSVTLGPTAALTAADDIAVAGVATNSTIGTNTPTLSGMTVLGGLNTAGRGWSGYAILTAATAVSTTGTITSSPLTTIGAVATYKQSAAPAPPGNAGAGFLAIL